MRSTLPVILASLGIVLLAGCAAGPGPVGGAVVANDPSLQPSAVPQLEPGTVATRMNGEFSWYGGVAGRVH